MKQVAFFGLILAILSIFAEAASAHSDCDVLAKKIDTVYGFKPSKLTESERTTKSHEMDEIWKFVNADVENQIPCLLSAIKKRSDDPFFRFDASNLVYQFEQGDDIKRLMVETYSEVDLADIDPSYWLPVMTRFGYEGIDISPAAETWLRYPSIQYYLPRHPNYPITSFKGSLILYGSMDEKFALASLKRMANSCDALQKVAGYALISEIATDEGDNFLRNSDSETLAALGIGTMIRNYLEKPRKIEARTGEPKTTRKEFIVAMQELISGDSEKFTDLTIEFDDGEKDMVAVLKKEDIPLLRKARRLYASALTPESTSWHKVFTDVINTIRLTPEKNTK